MKTGSKAVCVTLAAFIVTIISCGCEKPHAPYPGRTPSGEGGQQGEVPEASVLNLTPIAELNQGAGTVNSHKGATGRSHLMRDYRSYTNFSGVSLGGDYPVYPRITRAKNGKYILVYHQGNSSTWAGDESYMLSSDDLVTWRSHGKFNGKVAITDDFGYANTRGYAGPNILTLSNGDILYSVSYRAISGKGGHHYRENHNSGGILVRRSKDNGVTWDNGISIFTGINWESHMVEMPNGDIHCYFTNSDPSLVGVVPEWPDVTNNSGTAVVISKDGGYTWDYKGYVVRQARGSSGDVVLFTDQMPVVIPLNETGELAGAFESQMKPPAGTKSDYHISLAYSGEGRTEYPILTGNTLGPADRQNSYVKGCAPFIVQFPSGETALSYNESNKIYLHLGDETARHFGTAQTPLLKNGFWNGMYVDGTHRLLLATGGSNKTLQLICLYLNHDIAASSRTVTVDGSNAEWQKTDDALFVGSKSQAQATLRCSADAENLYLLVEVLDENISTSDYATVTLAGAGVSSVSNGSVRVQVSAAGIKSQAVYKSSWFQESFGAEAVPAIDGTADKTTDTDNGWLCEVKIPKSALPASVEGKLALNFAFFDMAGGEDTVAAQTQPGQWPELTGLK